MVLYLWGDANKKGSTIVRVSKSIISALVSVAKSQMQVYKFSENPSDHLEVTVGVREWPKVNLVPSKVRWSGLGKSSNKPIDGP